MHRSSSPSAPAQPVLHRQHASLAPRGGVRVVVVDDSDHFRAGLVRALGRAPGVSEVVDAPDGATGLHLIRTLLPDVAVVDDRMPGLGGVDVARAVSGDPVLRGVRVVVLSGSPTEGLAARATAAGAVGTLDKNATRRELCEAIAATARAAA
jgi:DNA-binding NarL/FixJ family response regulator